MPDLSTEEVAKLKAAFGPIFKFAIKNESHYFRTLTRSEVVALGLMDGEIEPDKEDDIILTALVYPQRESLDDLPAGIPSQIAQQIVARSGLSDPNWLNEYIDRAKKRQTAYHTISATICAAFPSLLPGDLDELNIEALMSLLVQAEEILRVRALVNVGQYVSLSFESDEVDPQAQSKADAKRKEAALLAALESGMEGVPTGWIDVGKKPAWAGDNVDPTGGI